MLAFVLLCSGQADAAKKKAAKKKTPKAPGVTAPAEPQPASVPEVVANDPESQLAAAERAYDDYEYDRAIAQFKGLIDKPNVKVRQRARLMLAFSLYFKKDEPSAREQLRELFRETTEYAIDRDEHHPDLVRFYDTERNTYVHGLVVAPVAVEPQIPVSNQDPVVPAKAPVQTLGDKYPWVRIFPGGIGHMFNHDYAVGAMFMTLEALFIGANVTGYILRYNVFRDPANQVFLPGAFEAQIVLNIGSIGAITVAVISIIDAFAWSPARGRRSLEASMRVVDLGPLGSYTFAFGL